MNPNSNPLSTSLQTSQVNVHRPARPPAMPRQIPPSGNAQALHPANPQSRHTRVSGHTRLPSLRPLGLSRPVLRERPPHQPLPVPFQPAIQPIFIPTERDAHQPLPIPFRPAAQPIFVPTVLTAWMPEAARQFIKSEYLPPRSQHHSETNTVLPADEKRAHKGKAKAMDRSHPHRDERRGG